ncbi:unnamed protein product [Victoria cruziana]
MIQRSLQTACSRKTNGNQFTARRSSVQRYQITEYSSRLPVQNASREAHKQKNDILALQGEPALLMKAAMRARSMMCGKGEGKRNGS